MGSVTYGGFYDDSDPIYQEGFTIVAPKMSTNEDSKNNDSAEDQKLLEYLPESSREHEVIGKWLSRMQEREKGNLPIDNNCFNNVSGKLELDNEVATILLDTFQSHLPNFRWHDQDDNLRSVRVKKTIKERKVQLFPLHLFTINWATSGPRMTQ